MSPRKHKENFLLNFSLTWLSAIGVLFFLYSPKVILTMCAGLLILLAISLLILSLLSIAPWIRHNRWALRLNSRTTILDYVRKPVSQYKQVLKDNTEKQVAKLTQSEQYKRYCVRKEELQKKGDNQPIMCSLKTAMQISHDIFEFKKMERLFFQ